MSRIRKNPAVHGASGKFGNLVYNQRHGKDFFSQAPEKTAPPTAAQKKINKRFKKAVAYGKASIANSSTKALYESLAKPGQSAYNVAIADFFIAPEIDEINTDGYTGATGNSIIAEVTDNVMVASVKVRIEKPDGNVVEQGNATISDDGLSWAYTATQSIPNISGFVVTVTAFDKPGNSSVKQKTL